MSLWITFRKSLVAHLKIAQRLSENQIQTPYKIKKKTSRKESSDSRGWIFWQERHFPPHGQWHRLPGQQNFNVLANIWKSQGSIGKWSGKMREKEEFAEKSKKGTWLFYANSSFCLTWTRNSSQGIGTSINASFISDLRSFPPNCSCRRQTSVLCQEQNFFSVPKVDERVTLLWVRSTFVFLIDIQLHKSWI